MAEISPRSSPASRRGIIGLDLIRFLAALMVLFYHLGHRAWAPPIEEATVRRMFPNAPAFPDLEPAAWLGWVGVEVFFVLSGFVIANSAERSTARAFARNRTLRLWPAIMICAAITAGVLIMAKGFEPRIVADYARTVALPLFPRGPWVDSVYWTLIAEITFYSMIFVLLACNSFSRIQWLALAIGLGSSGLWFANTLFGVGDWILGSWVANVTLARHGCFFAIGVLLWLMLFKRVTLVRLAVVAVCLVAGVLEVGALANEKAEVIGREFNVLAAQVVFLLGVAAIVLSTIFDRQLRAVVGRGAAIFPWLGLMTYPLYLVHNFAGVATMNALSQAGAQRHVALLGAASLMVALAWLITRMAEPVVVAAMKGGFVQVGERWAELRLGLARLGVRRLQTK